MIQAMSKNLSQLYPQKEVQTLKHKLPLKNYINKTLRKDIHTKGKQMSCTHMRKKGKTDILTKMRKPDIPKTRKNMRIFMRKRNKNIPKRRRSMIIFMRKRNTDILKRRREPDIPTRMRSKDILKTRRNMRIFMRKRNKSRRQPQP